MITNLVADKQNSSFSAEINCLTCHQKFNAKFKECEDIVCPNCKSFLEVYVEGDEGKLVTALGPPQYELEKIDTLEKAEWIRQQRNKPELMKYFRQNKEITEQEQTEWFKKIDYKTIHPFIAIENRKFDGKRIKDRLGYVGLNPVDLRHKHAEFGIFVLPMYQGIGYGGHLLKLILDYGFNRLKLKKIYSDVLKYPRENRFDFYKKLGFKKDGYFRQHYFKNGKWISSIHFSIFAKDWNVLPHGTLYFAEHGRFK